MMVAGHLGRIAPCKGKSREGSLEQGRGVNARLPSACCRVFDTQRVLRPMRGEAPIVGGREEERLVRSAEEVGEGAAVPG